MSFQWSHVYYSLAFVSVKICQNQINNVKKLIFINLKFVLNYFQSGKSLAGVVRELEVFKKSAQDLLPGDRGGAFVRLKTDMDLKRGLVTIICTFSMVNNSTFLCVSFIKPKRNKLKTNCRYSSTFLL
jgi:hypothetical protein